MTASLESAARRIFKSVQEMVPGRFVAVPATRASHPHVRWDAYEARGGEARALGFRHLGDVDPVSIHLDPGATRRAVMRLYLHEDRRMVLVHYRLPLRWTPKGILMRLMGGAGDYFDVVSNFDDGTAFLSTTAGITRVWDQPVFLKREHFRRDTTLAALVARHRERIAAHAAANPASRVVRASTLDEVVALADRTERRKRRWREANGWVSRAELARFGQLPDDKLDALMVSIRMLIASEPPVPPYGDGDPSADAGEPPEPDASPEAVREKVDALRRRAWFPDAAEEDGARDGSKFSGIPWLHPGEAWPACGNCGRPMQLFLQLHARDLPEAAAERLDGGLLQLFYCTSSEPLCEVDAEAFAPYARSTLLRLVPPDALAAEPAPAGPGPEDAFPPRRIVSWRGVDDYPAPFEAEEEHGVPYDAYTERMGDDEFPRTGDKLLGWPAWVQNVEYPSCLECDARMELLFQVDSEDNLPYMFGDVGTGHITQCPRHRHRLAFGWACH